MSSVSSFISMPIGPVARDGEGTLVAYTKNSQTNCLLCKTKLIAPHGLNSWVDTQKTQVQITRGGKKILALDLAFVGSDAQIGRCNAGFACEDCIARSVIAPHCVFCNKALMDDQPRIATHSCGEEQYVLFAHVDCPKSRSEPCTDACCDHTVPDPETVPAALIKKEIDAGAEEMR